MNVVTTFTTVDLESGLESWLQRARKAILEAGEIIARKCQAYAQANRPWMDWTSNARQGLTARAVMEGTKLIIYLFHTMDYGRWLELKHNGRYAIIMRTLQTHYPMLTALLLQVIGG